MIELIAKFGGCDVDYDRFIDKLFAKENKENYEIYDLSEEEIIEQVSRNTGIKIVDSIGSEE